MDPLDAFLFLSRDSVLPVSLALGSLARPEVDDEVAWPFPSCSDDFRGRGRVSAPALPVDPGIEDI